MESPAEVRLVEGDNHMFGAVGRESDMLQIWFARILYEYPWCADAGRTLHTVGGHELAP
jgi:hypothetical protein